jgi:hypothetical protein
VRRIDVDAVAERANRAGHHLARLLEEVLLAGHEGLFGHPHDHAVELVADLRHVARTKDRSANGTSASVGLAGRIIRSNSRGWSAWMRSDRGVAELLFDVLSTAYERQSLIVTTNLPFEQWTEVLGSERLTGAALDRLTHRCHILEARGESFRLRDSRRRQRRASGPS